MGIAEFVDGHGELVDVHSWFRFNCGSPANAYLRRRMAIESATPLSVELMEQIESLYRTDGVQATRPMLRILDRVAALLRRGHLAAQSPIHREHQSFRQAPPAS